MLFEQLVQEHFDYHFTSLSLYQDIRNIAVLISHPSEVVDLAFNFEDYFIQMSFVPRSETSATNLTGKGLPELVA